MARFTSSTKPLAANATYNSGPIQVGGGNETLKGGVFSDKAGTLNIDQSLDSTNWDLTTAVQITAGVGTPININPNFPYVRLRFVNGSTDQTAFRIAVRTASTTD